MTTAEHSRARARDAEGPWWPWLPFALSAALIVTAVEAFLLERKLGLFTGGFLAISALGRSADRIRFVADLPCGGCRAARVAGVGGVSGQRLAAPRPDRRHAFRRRHPAHARGHCRRRQVRDRSVCRRPAGFQSRDRPWRTSRRAARRRMEVSAVAGCSRDCRRPRRPDGHWRRAAMAAGRRGTVGGWTRRARSSARDDDGRLGGDRHGCRGLPFVLARPELDDQRNDIRSNGSNGHRFRPRRMGPVRSSGRRRPVRRTNPSVCG